MKTTMFTSMLQLLLTCLIILLQSHITFAASNASLSVVRYGAFAPCAAFSIAQQLGLFEAYGVSVKYQLVPNSTYAYQALLSGDFDVISGTSDNVINYRFNMNKPLTMLGQNQGDAISVVSSLSLHSLEDLRGKTLLVDAVTSGYAYVLRKILKDVGLQLNKDYLFLVSRIIVQSIAVPGRADKSHRSGHRWYGRPIQSLDNGQTCQRNLDSRYWNHQHIPLHSLRNQSVPSTDQCTHASIRLCLPIRQ